MPNRTYPWTLSIPTQIFLKPVNTLTKTASFVIWKRTPSRGICTKLTCFEIRETNKLQKTTRVIWRVASSKTVMRSIQDSDMSLRRGFLSSRRPPTLYGSPLEFVFYNWNCMRINKVITCESSRFSSLLAAWDISRNDVPCSEERGEKAALQFAGWQNNVNDWSRTDFKDCLWLAGKTIAIVT